MNFRIIPADTFIWNLSELVDFLIANQNTAITIENGHEGCCAQSVGLYQWLDKFKFTQVSIDTANILETHPVYNIKHNLAWSFLDVRSAVEPEYHAWNKQFVFGTIYGRPLWHRLALAAHLSAHHADISSVGFVADPADPDRREFFELTQLWQHSPGSVADFVELQKQIPLVHKRIDTYTPGATLTDGFVAQSKQVYQDFLIDIVAETFTTGNCFFITEKTVRPMLLKKPFVVFGSRDYLAYLRQLGFRTFNDFWDEDYDGYDGASRLIKIQQLIDNLAQKPISELEQMYWDMQYTLDHNYNLLMSQTYQTKITQL